MIRLDWRWLGESGLQVKKQKGKVGDLAAAIGENGVEGTHGRRPYALGNPWLSERMLMRTRMPVR
jgi:hypothetical protein